MPTRVGRAPLLFAETAQHVRRDELALLDGARASVFAPVLPVFYPIGLNMRVERRSLLVSYRQPIL